MLYRLLLFLQFLLLFCSLCESM
uniref:Uncharacterized protein n=1 Tax=Arundo donax TaxID=35708 RepID=A0A0A8ZZ37_ARUDO